MGPKYKVTGCARFVLFLVIFIPVVFFAAALIRGENGVDVLKGYYYKITGKKEMTSSSTHSPETLSVEELQRQLKDAQEKIEELEKALKEKNEELDKLKSSQSNK